MSNAEMRAGSATSGNDQKEDESWSALEEFRGQVRLELGKLFFLQPGAVAKDGLPVEQQKVFEQEAIRRAAACAELDSHGEREIQAHRTFLSTWKTSRFWVDGVLTSAPPAGLFAVMQGLERWREKNRGPLTFSLSKAPYWRSYLASPFFWTLGVSGILAFAALALIAMVDPLRTAVTSHFPDLSNMSSYGVAYGVALGVFAITLIFAHDAWHLEVRPVYGRGDSAFKVEGSCMASASTRRREWLAELVAALGDPGFRFLEESGVFAKGAFLVVGRRMVRACSVRSVVAVWLPTGVLQLLLVALAVLLLVGMVDTAGHVRRWAEAWVGPTSFWFGAGTPFWLAAVGLAIGGSAALVWVFAMLIVRGHWRNTAHWIIVRHGGVLPIGVGVVPAVSVSAALVALEGIISLAQRAERN
jgi:hypothetical protein